MNKSLSGQCLCGEVKFRIGNTFKAFYQCHCKQCQQLTGSAFASNLFTAPGNIEWLKGQNNVEHFEHSEREFSKSFCKKCGSALPFVNKTKTSLIVPAGSLDEQIELQPEANIFTGETASWLKPGQSAKEFPGFPE